MVRKSLVGLLCVLVVGVFATDPAFARGKKDRLVDTDEYKEDDFEKGIIDDYSDLVEGDGVEWVWLDPSVKLSKYNISFGKVKNMSSVSDKGMMSTLKDGFAERFESEGKSGTLTAETAVYWAERYSAGKSWIPYAGGHLSQAGVGVEMILKDSKGKVVAKIRHSGRQGTQPEEAAEEVMDEIIDFLQSN